ncbi:hypothetical protein DICSQDRAFT_175108 [Dichomitus squalens LYAD-421 SS1]|uniref:Uncharacterized protein n=1 Tax=Dichomitus squalens (strain LYAD-421) TaxID=732165 RepID=R7SJA6_DICSQ|nr:uncharacterized protein DICSQDRAFT_175108 [Dichomitus squalens LYAD-421 SS1]EJF56209.1 hypothetical protein DICSQDRAFT_175108 [Dichomitus squalens LYAD-421 SS1]
MQSRGVTDIAFSQVQAIGQTILGVPRSTLAPCPSSTYQLIPSHCLPVLLEIIIIFASVVVVLLFRSGVLFKPACKGKLGPVEARLEPT